jgi:hypothetical protein
MQVKASYLSRKDIDKITNGSYVVESASVYGKQK